jgi:hypothetical protein
MMGDRVTAAVMVGDVCRLVMAGIFAQAAVHSLRDWAVYEAIVQAYRLAPRALARMAARALPVAQIAAAVLLLTPAASRVGPAVGLALMVLFTSAIAINVRRGRLHIDCGFGGAAGQQLSHGLVVRNLVLCTLLAAAFVAPAALPPSTAFAVGVAGASLAAGILYVASGQLLANAQALAA